MTRDKFKKAVLRQLIEDECGIRKFSKRVGVHPSTLWKFLHGFTHSPRLAVRICRELGLPVRLAHATCGLDEEETKHGEEVEC